MIHLKDVLREDKWQGASSPVSARKILCVGDCTICGGIGFVRFDVEITDPHFGKAFPCPKLPPESSIFQGHGLTVSEIKNFKFSDITLRENINDAISAVKELLEFGNGVGYLYGGAGLAKTKILQTMCAEWARGGRGIFHFTTQKDILDQMRMAFDDDEPQRRIVEIQDKFIGYSLLAIDEITVERSTDFKVEQFFHVINKRHEAGTERGEEFITVMAGNVSPRDLDFRITDRLTDDRNFIVQLTGESYRPMMKRNG